MGLFAKKEAVKRDILLDEIRKLSTQVAELKGDKEAATEAISMSRNIVDLQKQKTALEIELDRVKEAHEREKREIEHKVGLQRKTQEFEVTAAKRDTELTVREGNLKAERERFEQEMKFMRERMEKEIEHLRSHMDKILERLPTVKVDEHIRAAVGGPATNGASSNGDD